METVRICRENALRCLKMAAESNDCDLRRELLAMAAAWRRVAEGLNDEHAFLQGPVTVGESANDDDGFELATPA